MTTENKEQTTERAVYRLLSAKLRVQRGPGREDLVVARPVATTAKGEAKRDPNGNVSYLDSDEAPTLVTFDEHCQVRVDQLLRIGAIVPATPAQQTANSKQQRAGAAAPGGEAVSDG